MLREICEFFAALSVQRPLALVFEDLHWSDYSTVDMLSALARHRTHARLMVVATYRPEDVEVAHHPLGRLNRDLGLQKLCHDIVLGPLSKGAIAEYLQGKAQQAQETASRNSYASAPAAIRSSWWRRSIIWSLKESPSPRRRAGSCMCRRRKCGSKCR